MAKQNNVSINNKQLIYGASYSGEGDSNRFFDFDERYTSYEIMGENVNAGLKQFAKRINYPKAITLYCARHSWASIAHKTGVQRSVICDGLGHKNRENRICDIYIHRIVIKTCDNCEDIDLVQIHPGPIKPIMFRLGEVLSWMPDKVTKQ